MSTYVTIDFSRVGDEDPADVDERTLKTRKNRAERRERLERTPLAEENPELVNQMLPSVADTAPQGTPLPPELIEAAKATFTASGGNISEVCRVHDLSPQKVMQLAHVYSWPVYGEGVSSAERSRRGRLEQLAHTLEKRLHEIGESLGVEKKALDDVTEKGLNSKWVAPLNQRSSAFGVVFDRYMRVMALLEPELFGADDDPSNPVAAKVRQKQQRDSLGGVDGVNRQLAEFAARVAVGTVSAMEAERADRAEVIDVHANG